jgi:hypothetical protein
VAACSRHAMTTRGWSLPHLTPGRCHCRWEVESIDDANDMQGIGQDKGLAGLFSRIANLGKGVVIGSVVGMVWQSRHLIRGAIGI